RLKSKEINVIPHGVDARFRTLDRTRLEPFLLCVSTLHPHKNLDRLLKAYANSRIDKRLICAGMLGYHAENAKKTAASLGLGDKIEFTGWIPRDALYDLYARAHAVVYPSLFEGFGMPVLEAMAAGIPVTCSAIPPLREIAGDAVLFFEPLSVDAI